MRQVLPPRSDARGPARQGRRCGYDKYSLEDAEHFIPDTETLDDKFSFPEALTLVRQDLLPRSEDPNPGVRQRPCRTLDPETDPEPRNPKICRTLMCDPFIEPYFINEISIVAH